VVYPGWTNDASIILQPVRHTLQQFGTVTGVIPSGTYDHDVVSGSVHQHLLNGQFEEVILIGCSLGAMTAMDYIRHYAGGLAPFKIKLLFNCGVVSVEDVRRDFRLLVKYGSPILRGGPALDRFYPRLAEHFFEHDRPIPLEEGPDGHDPAALERHHLAMWHCPTRLSMSQLRALRTSRPLYPGELDGIPTGIIAYEDDQMVDPSAVERQKDAGDNYYQFLKLPGYGHDDWVERPRQGNEALSQVLIKLCQRNVPWPIEG